MKRALLKKFLYAFSYMLCALLMEFITFNVMGLGAFAEYFWFDILFVTLFGLVIFIIPSYKVSSALIIVFLGCQTALSFVNQAMHNDSMLRTVFTFDQMTSTKAMAGVFNNEYVSWIFLIGLIAIIIGEFLFLVLLRRIKVKNIESKRFLSFSIVFFLLMQTFVGSFYGMAYNNLYSTSDSEYLFQDDKQLYNNTEYGLKLKAFKKFGTFAFYYKNLYNFLKIDTKEEIKSALTDIDDYLSNNGMGISYSSANGNYSAYTGALKGRNLIVIMIETGEWFGIDEELTPTLYALSQQGLTNKRYYSKNKTNHSETICNTGSFPTNCDFGSKLKSDVEDNLTSFGFTIANVLKRSGYQTSYMHNNTGEFYDRVFTHGALGFDKLYFIDYMNNKSNCPDFVSHKADLNDFYDFESDYETLKSMSPIIAPANSDKPFMSHYTSMCMHGNYNDLYDFAQKIGNDFWDYTDGSAELDKRFKNDSDTNDFFCEYYDKITKEKFKQKFPNITVDENSEEYHTIYLRYKQYQAAFMDFDRGVNSMMEHLIENNILQNTTIVLFGDHDCYYHNQNFFLRGYDTSEMYNLDLYKVPFIMFDGSMSLTVDKNEYYANAINYGGNGQEIFKDGIGNVVSNDGVLTIDNWASSYDIVPTLLDLLGYSFNTKLYQGISVFSDIPDENRSIIYSLESGMFNEDIFASSLGKCYMVIGDNVYYVIDDEPDRVLRLINQDESEEISESSAEYIAFSEKLQVFKTQHKLFIDKNQRISNLYRYKYFSCNKLKDKDGNLMYPYSQIERHYIEL